MEAERLNGLKVAILVTDDFEQVELTEPRKALDQAGALTLILSPHLGNVHGFNHDRPGDEFKVDLAIDEANASDFDAVLLPGGALSADKLRMERAAQQFVRNMDQAEKPFAVICHAPWLLVSSGLVRGRTLTSYYTLQDDIRNAGGIWQDRSVVRDHNWITSRQPKDIPAFNQAMLELFHEAVGAQRHAGAVRGAGSGDHGNSELQTGSDLQENH
ncbi:MAG: type 1 glutamine amidotransferase [Anaerolineaceae bacterium]|nr:type 1 glutamine amidotransferase [Anaerolineaceae bacterium]